MKILGLILRILLYVALAVAIGYVIFTIQNVL